MDFATSEAIGKLLYGAVFAASAGVWGWSTKKGPRFWRYVYAALATHFAVAFLFSAGGTLEDPAGDGPITLFVRQATGDGIGMALMGLVVMALAWVAPIAIASKGARLDADGE